MSSKSIYTIPYTYLIGWSSLDLYYYGRRTAVGCHPSDFFETYFTSSIEVESYVSEYGRPDIVQIRRTFTSSEDCCEWECTVLRRLDAKNNFRFLNKTNGDSEWIYSGVDAVWMNRNGKNRRVRREHIENYQDMDWAEGRSVDWIWIKHCDSGKNKRVAVNEVKEYLENGWERGRDLNVAGERNGMYGKVGKNSFRFNGYWHTPFGIYESLNDAVKNSPIKVSSTTLHGLCSYNERVITKHSYERTRLVKYLFEMENAVGYTPYDLGFKHE